MNWTKRQERLNKYKELLQQDINIPLVEMMMKRDGYVNEYIKKFINNNRHRTWSIEDIKPCPVVFNSDQAWDELFDSCLESLFKKANI